MNTNVIALADYQTPQVRLDGDEFAAFQSTLTPIEHEGRPMFDARTLHGWLGVKMRFHEWIGKRVEVYQFEEGSDFCCVHSKTRGRPRTDYLLTRDMAKELAMVENNEIGRRTRRYFIQMESAANQMAHMLAAEGRAADIPQAYIDASAIKAELTAHLEARLAEIEARLLKPKEPTPLPDFVTARGVAEHMGILDVRLPASAQVDVCRKLGLELTGFCRLNGYEVRTERSAGQTTNRYARAGVEAWLTRRTA